VWFCARKNGVLAAYQLCFLFKGKIVFWETDFDPSFSESGPGYFLKDRILNWGLENGYKEAGFGQTPTGAKGAVEFKERMGGEAQPVFEYTHASLVKRKLRAFLDGFRGRA
ncbi:MAG: GNAT family N-acetyltransferase, partial [Limisphaerales bacterium]